MQQSNGQTANDSVTYWINPKYLSCLDSGKSVCNCQELNSILIMHLDTIVNKMRVHPSIYYSEDFEFNFKQDKNHMFTILRSYEIDSGSVFNIKADHLILTTPKQTTLFTKIKVQPIDTTWIEGDMWRQIGVINCKPLLKYSIKSCNDSSIFPLTTKILADHISKGQAIISCSDDYYYNEMRIKITDTNYYLLYESDTVKIYNEPERGRGDKVDITTLRECATFFKPKQTTDNK